MRILIPGLNPPVSFIMGKTKCAPNTWCKTICVLCLKKIMSIRVLPVRLRFDNGTNFIGAKEEILTASKLYDQDVIRSELFMKGIEWLFNCPSNTY